MKVRFNGRELELWEGAQGSDLLSPEEQMTVDAGEMVLWEEHAGWTGLGGALHSKGTYTLLDARIARLRMLPSVDCLLAHPALVGLPHEHIVHISRILLADLRARILHGEKIVPQLESIVTSILSAPNAIPMDEALAVLPDWSNPSLVMLADPFQSLCDALRRIASNGMLALPRQHLAESGGQRVEDFIMQAGWIAMPLGTINRCKHADFRKAVNSGANAMAFLTPDNYVLQGFTTNAEPKDLAELAIMKVIPFLYYQGKSDAPIE